MKSFQRTLVCSPCTYDYILGARFAWGLGGTPLIPYMCRGAMKYVSRMYSVAVCLRGSSVTRWSAMCQPIGPVRSISKLYESKSPAALHSIGRPPWFYSDRPAYFWLRLFVGLFFCFVLFYGFQACQPYCVACTFATAYSSGTPM